MAVKNRSFPKAGRPKKEGELAQRRKDVLFYPSEWSEVEEHIKEKSEVAGADIKPGTYIHDLVMKDVRGGYATPSREIAVPVIGSSVCGPLSEAIADTDEIRWLSEDMRRWLRAPEYACLIHAAGNSMERAGILDGDLLLLVPLPENARPRNGEITLTQIFTTDGGCESTVKYFHYANGEVVLRDGDSQEIKLPRNKERVEPIATVIGRIGRI